MASQKETEGYFYAGPDGTRRPIEVKRKRGPKPTPYSRNGKLQRLERVQNAWKNNPECWSKWYPMDRKIEACTLYAVYGNVEQVEQLTQIPAKELRSWMNDTWWQEIIKQVYVEQNDKLGATITELLNKSLSVLADRLENGDYYFTPKTGELKRKPVDAKVLTGLFNGLAIQRRLVRGEPTSITSNKQTLDDKLDRLAKEFKRFSRAKQINQEPEKLDALLEELPSRLQDGVQSIPILRRGEEEQSSSEQSQEARYEKGWETRSERL